MQSHRIHLLNFGILSLLSLFVFICHSAAAQSGSRSSNLGKTTSASSKHTEIAQPTKIVIDLGDSKGKVSRHLYGHFIEHLGSCVDNGLWVGIDSDIPNENGIRSDIIRALKQISIPVLRWPGGCFAETYHWRDGIGPASDRPVRIRPQWGREQKWGGGIEDNQFGTHEYFNLCEKLKCQPYLACNIGSGTTQELQEWVEYITVSRQTTLTELRKANGRENPWRLKFVGIGNESWGCGGRMSSKFYAEQFKKYANFAHDFDDNKLYRIACGAAGEDYAWTDSVMKAAHHRMQGLSLHYYCFSDREATTINDTSWYRSLSQALKLDKIISKHSKIMDKYDPDKKIGLVLDEWGSWHKAKSTEDSENLVQQNTICDAMVAALSLHIMHEHCDRVKMANIAQLVNVLQCLFLTKDSQLVMTPTFHVFDLLKAHQDSTLVSSRVLNGKQLQVGDMKLPQLSVSATVRNGKHLTVSLCNLDSKVSSAVDCQILNGAARSQSAMLLHGKSLNAHNTFASPNVVKPVKFDQVNLNPIGNKIGFSVPPRSILVLSLEL